MAKPNEKSPLEIKVNPNTIVGSAFSQVVGISVTDNDGTLDFVFVNSQTKEGQTVARITLPRKTLEGLAVMIVNTYKKHDEKKSSKIT